MKLAGLAFSLLLATSASAQVQTGVQSSDGALLRGLDTVTGQTEDIQVFVGDRVMFRRLEVFLTDCRYPTESPASEAYAFLTIRDIREDEPRFRGWMVASSPALSALDHPRYDVWVLRCSIPDEEASDNG